MNAILWALVISISPVSSGRFRVVHFIGLSAYQALPDPKIRVFRFEVSWLQIIALALLLSSLLWTHYGYGRRSQRLFWVVVLALVMSGVFLALHPIPRLEEFSHSLAHALMIAGFLAATVDFFVKDRLLREISLDVSKFLVGYTLPSEVQDRIRDIMQTTFIRRESDIRIHIKELPDRPGYVELDIETSDEVQNVANEPKEYRDVMSWEKQDPYRVFQLRCETTDPRAKYLLEGDDLIAKETKEEPGVMTAAGKKVKIPPVRSQGPVHYRFAGRYKVVLPENYSDLVSFSKPTINANLAIDCDDNFVVTADTATVESKNRWRYERLFLPGEFIRFRWRKKSEDVDNAR